MQHRSNLRRQGARQLPQPRPSPRPLPVACAQRAQSTADAAAQPQADIIGIINLTASKQRVVRLDGQTVLIRREVHPARPSIPGEQLCGCTQLVVRRRGQRDSTAPSPVYALVSAHVCGREAARASGRCRRHEGVPHIEVWAVRRATAPPQDAQAPGSATNPRGPAVGRRRPVTGPPSQQQPARPPQSRTAGTAAGGYQARLMYACETASELGQYLGLGACRGGTAHTLVFEDVWGSDKVSYEDQLAAEGVMVQHPAMTDAQKGQPRWLR